MSSTSKKTFRLSDKLTLTVALWKDNVYYHFNNLVKNKSVTLNKEEFDKIIDNSQRLIDSSKKMLDSIPKNKNKGKIVSFDAFDDEKPKKKTKIETIESLSSSDSD